MLVGIQICRGTPWHIDSGVSVEAAHSSTFRTRPGIDAPRWVEKWQNGPIYVVGNEA